MKWRPAAVIGLTVLGGAILMLVIGSPEQQSSSGQLGAPVELPGGDVPPTSRGQSDHPSKSSSKPAQPAGSVASSQGTNPDSMQARAQRSRAAIRAYTVGFADEHELDDWTRQELLAAIDHHVDAVTINREQESAGDIDTDLARRERIDLVNAWIEDTHSLLTPELWVEYNRGARDVSAEAWGP